MLLTFRFECSHLQTYLDVLDGHVIHVVKTASNQSQQSATSTAQPTPATNQPAGASAGAQQRSPLAGLGGLGGLGAGAGGGMPDPEMMRGLMESPMMQSMLNNPGKILVNGLCYAINVLTEAYHQS